jgi:hypothetical protein
MAVVPITWKGVTSKYNTQLDVYVICTHFFGGPL